MDISCVFVAVASGAISLQYVLRAAVVDFYP
jgi:hypothetical protein